MLSASLRPMNPIWVSHACPVFPSSTPAAAAGRTAEISFLTIDVVTSCIRWSSSRTLRKATPIVAILAASTPGVWGIQLFIEDFETGGTKFSLNTADAGSTTSTAQNLWVVNDAYAGGSGTYVCFGFPLSFTSPATPSQPAGISGDPNSNYLHLLSAAGSGSSIVNSHILQADGACFTAENHFAAMTEGVSTIGYSEVSLDFWWLSGGSSSVYGNVFFSTDGGSVWNEVGTPKYNNQIAWTEESISETEFANQADLRFGFRLVNGTGSDSMGSAFSIDNVTINAVPEPSAAMLAVLGAIAFVRRRSTAR